MKLDGVMIWVQDVPATVAFYEKAFGLAVTQLDDAQQFAMLDTGETTLQFTDERAAAGTGVSVRPHRPDTQARRSSRSSPTTSARPTSARSPRAP